MKCGKVITCKNHSYIINNLINIIIENPDYKINVIVPNVEEIVEIIFEDLQRKRIILNNIDIFVENDLNDFNLSDDTIYIAIYFDKFGSIFQTRFKVGVENKYYYILNKESSMTDKKIRNAHSNIFSNINKKKNFITQWVNRKELNNEEIPSCIKNAIEIVENRIYLSVPWINYQVFLQFEKGLIAALKRGVQVKIFYGYSKDDERTSESDKAVKKIKLDMLEFNNLSFEKISSHKKLTLFDNFYISTSFNYFSNMCSDKNPDEVGEIRIIDEEEAQKKIKSHFTGGK